MRGTPSGDSRGRVLRRRSTAGSATEVTLRAWPTTASPPSTPARASWLSSIGRCRSSSLPDIKARLVEEGLSNPQMD